MRVVNAPGSPVASAPREGDDARLRKVARQMEGVFVQELYKAMRATVPQSEGAVGGGAGEEMFTGLMDQHLATETPHAWGRGLGEAIYQHLRGRLARESGAAAAPTEPAPTTPAPQPLPLRDVPAAMPLTATPEAGR
ncbi:rod-binding protein [Roseisolibacter sp. H3M3-2]|uniref:rod-binding protein n=1 Tax=Roseisolibacter sp. H3M3-2 TaxID=3031323 RepID=UPI0023DC2A55|nr:rod-binding protein [Roseisolibacter sp. H3M3-2]MDF1506060.1 rod-binding protein [Roseisolibacter sp. H3M3-2]